MLSTTLIIISALLLLAVVWALSKNLILVGERQSSATADGSTVANAPSGSSHKLSKGYDIKLAGEAANTLADANVTRYAIRPKDFRGIAPIPKLLVQVGDEVKAGQPIMFDKQSPDIKYVSPVSGEFIEIVRGAKRAIDYVVILADKNQEFYTNPTLNVASATQEEVKSYLMDKGAWPYINKRPFDVVADPAVVPNNIFVSTFDTAPLAPDTEFLLKGKKKYIQAGINALAKLTDGQVHLGVKGSNNWMGDLTNCAVHSFDGKHPAGNVGVHIHHVAPIKAGDAVWTLDIQSVASIGKLVIEGTLDFSRTIALTGAEFENPAYIKTYMGANVGDLVNNHLKSSEGEVRLVDGNVLTGRSIGADDFLSFKSTQITALSEGKYNEFLGWLVPIAPRPSVSGTFPNFMYKNYKHVANTNTHGEKRAFVVTGDYEKYLPMDIYVQHLMKSIITNDYERMENLGINELTEEDVALCEFTCVSKQPLQQILRKGLDMVREQS